MLMASLGTAVVAATILGSVACQATLVVPSTQFSNLQDAVNAASPGDRILVQGSVQHNSSLYGNGDLVIDKSLTIQGDPTGTIVISDDYMSSHNQVLVTSLTPGIPLILRDMTIEFRNSMPSISVVNISGLICKVPGEIQLERVVVRSYDDMPGPVINLDTSRVWMRDVEVTGASRKRSSPCPVTYY